MESEGKAMLQGVAIGLLAGACLLATFFVAAQWGAGPSLACLCALCLIGSGCAYLKLRKEAARGGEL